LSTIHIVCQNIGGTVFTDKASFLFGQINRDSDKSSNEPVERYNRRFTDLLSNYYDISCVILPEIYLKTSADNRIEKEKEYAKFKDNNYKERVLNFMKDKLFMNLDGQAMNTITFDELNDLSIHSRSVSFYFTWLKFFIIFLILSFLPLILYYHKPGNVIKNLMKKIMKIINNVLKLCLL